jgi:hypothetical protein
MSRFTMSFTSAFAAFRSRLAMVFRSALKALTAPQSSRQLPALSRRTRHRPGQTSLRRDS